MKKQIVRSFINEIISPVFDEVKVKVLREEEITKNTCDYILTNKAGKTGKRIGFSMYIATACITKIKKKLL